MKRRDITRFQNEIPQMIFAGKEIKLKKRSETKHVIEASIFG
jgi:hypothetical protein